jgi:AraC-like DNA-binding protein
MGNERILRRVDALGGLELLAAGRAHFHYPAHAHEEFMIAVTEEGMGSPSFHGQEHPAPEGSVIVIGPGEVQSGGSARGQAWAYRSLYPTAGLMARIRGDLGSGKPRAPDFPPEVIHDPPLAALLQRAHFALCTDQDLLEGEDLMVRALSALTLRHAGRTEGRPEGRGDHPGVQRAMDYLQAYSGRNVTLGELAEVAGLSPYHLARTFRRQTGLSPHRYQIVVRVRRAKSLLAQGMGITDAALEAGFFDQAHLARHFARIVGVPPGQYHAAGRQARLG